jgi:DNA-binding NtrC family response regulator
MARLKEILVVEDDPDTLDCWVHLFKDAGYRVAGAATFEEGRRALQSAPDLLITDIRLGAYNGLQLVVNARSVYPRLPIIVLTGYHDSVLQSETERLDALYMRKPVDGDQMLAFVAQTLMSAESQAR